MVLDTQCEYAISFEKVKSSLEKMLEKSPSSFSCTFYLLPLTIIALLIISNRTCSLSGITFWKLLKEQVALKRVFQTGVLHYHLMIYESGGLEIIPRRDPGKKIYTEDSRRFMISRYGKLEHAKWLSFLSEVQW